MPAIDCKLKQKCPNKDAAIHNCWNPDCDGWMHKGCSDMLLAKFDIPVGERPSETELTEAEEPFVFCKKGCYSKWRSAKKREEKAAAVAAKAATNPAKKRKVPWEEDGSLDVLMEWLTTEGNYAEYCGANGNKGKTKTQHHKEVSMMLKERLPDCERNEKDVENKITSLERQFQVASDWANNTGQGVDKPGDFEAAIKKRCPLFDELEPIMGDRPNAKPLATTEDDEVIDSDGEESGVADIAAFKSLNNPAGDSEDENNTPPKKLASLSSVSSGSSKRRVSATKEAPNKRSNKTNDILATFLGMDDGNDQNGFKQLRVREVVAREKEATARMLEARAVSKKAETEANLLSIQEKATLLRERKKLLEEGISQDEINSLLPLPK